LFQSKEYKYFKIAALFSVVLAMLVAIFLIIYGKTNSFLVVNKLNGPYFDYVFKYYTYLGDGLIWVPIFLYTIFYKKDFLIAIIASVIICTILTHFLKRVVFPNELRPIGVLANKIRTIPGLYINRANSFPSGHTSTAFTLALLLAYVGRRFWFAIVFPLIAFFVGYSRVYLAQHFVTDVLAGILIGIVSAYLSLLVYNHYYLKRKLQTNQSIDSE
jgi:membrane-associated phospholipid phosphatase